MERRALRHLVVALLGDIVCEFSEQEEDEGLPDPANFATLQVSNLV